MTRNLSLTYPRSLFVGFEPLFSELERLTTATPGQDNYPPHNIVKIDDENFNIEMAVAGFSKDDVEVELKDGKASIIADKGKVSADQLIKAVADIPGGRYKATAN